MAFTLVFNRTLTTTNFSLSGCNWTAVDSFRRQYTTPDNPTSLTGFGNNSFSTYLTEVLNIPNSVTYIEAYAFSNEDNPSRGCLALTSITIPTSVTSIGNSAFRGCIALPSINIPSSLTSIQLSTFSRCTALTSVNIPSDSMLTSIQTAAFSSCTALTSITIPNSVTFIGDTAFYSCTSLPSINIPNSVTSIEQSAFDSCTSLPSINIPASVTYIGAFAFSNCSKLASISVDVNNTNYSNNNQDGNLYNKVNGNLTTLIQYAIGKTDTLFSIPNGVTSIGTAAFKNSTKLTSINIPATVTSIKYHAFNNCVSLTSINIPSDSMLTSIETEAFSSCTALTSITIPVSITSIVEYVFYYCIALPSINIPASVTYIGSGAFYNCNNLKKVIVNSPLYVSTESDAFTGINSHSTLYTTSANIIPNNDSLTNQFTNVYLTQQQITTKIYVIKTNERNDLGDIFQPYTTGSQPAETTGYNVNGIDLNQIFLSYATGSQPAETTGYNVDGIDLNQIFNSL